MTTAQLEPEQKQTIETEIAPALQRARSIVVKNQDQKAEALSFIKTLKGMKEAIEEKFHPTANKKKAYELYEDTLETEKAFYGPIDEAVKISNAAVKSFETEVALQVQRDAQEAEAKRLEAERKERDKLELKAEKAEEKGQVEKAEVYREQAQNVSVTPRFAPPPPSVKKLVWKAKVINPLLACRSIGEGLIPFNAVEFKQSSLNELGKIYETMKKPIPGIEFTQEVAR